MIRSSCKMSEWERLPPQNATVVSSDTSDFYEPTIVAEMSANKTNINAFIALDERASETMSGTAKESRNKEITWRRRQRASERKTTISGKFYWTQICATRRRLCGPSKWFEGSVANTSKLILKLNFPTHPVRP